MLNPYHCTRGRRWFAYLVDLLRQLVEVGRRGPVPDHVVVLAEDVPPRGVEAERAEDQHEIGPLETLANESSRYRVKITGIQYRYT